MALHIGETGMASYHAENLDGRSHAITGTATYNVQPDKMGKYFVKIQWLLIFRADRETARSRRHAGGL